MVSALIQQVVIMAALMALGFLLRRRGMIDQSGTSQLSDLVLYVANPVLIVQSLMMPFDATKVYDGAWCAVVTGVIMGLTIIATQRVFAPEQSVARFGVIFSNCGFIGIPLVQSVLGTEYVFYLSLCNMVQTVLIWTYGVLLMSGDRGEISFARVVLNPCIIALALGLLCFAFSFEAPEPLDALLTPVSDLNTGLVMIVLGSYLASADLRSMVRSRLVYESSLLRLVGVPLALTALLAAVPMSGADVKIAVIVTLATPAASTTAMFADKYGRDYRLGSGIVAMSAILSLLTMPVLVSLATMVL